MISVTGPQALNGLPNDIRSADSIQTFKKKLTFYFANIMI